MAEETSRKTALSAQDATAASQTQVKESPVLVSVDNAAAIVTLNRPRQLHALSTEMRAKIASAVPGFARNPEIYGLIIGSSGGRAFCAGGDVREMFNLLATDPAAAREALAAEYKMNWLLECFTKPTLSLMDGMVMGSGAGLTLYGTHRIGAEHYQFAMPEAAIGLFPDVGVTSVLARLPGAMGQYLGLTGARVNRADAFWLDLVTHCIDAKEFAAIIAEISDAEPVDPVLDCRHRQPDPGPLQRLAPLIDHCFGAPNVEAIIERLELVRGDQEPWARQTLSSLAAMCPLSLKITHRLIGAAQTMDLRQTLQFDYRLACRFLGNGEFAEGVRAALIDKDGRPQWRYSKLSEIGDELLDQYFAPLQDGELELLSREQMQAI